MHLILNKLFFKLTYGVTQTTLAKHYNTFNKNQYLLKLKDLTYDN